MAAKVSVDVTPEEGHRFAIAVRDHIVYVDQPTTAGGADSAPTPLELFLASLAACVAHYARGYLDRHDLASDGLAVHANGDLVNGPARLDEIVIELTLPASFPEERRAALVAVANKCTVHNTLEHQPTVRIEAAVGAAVAAHA